MGSMGFSRLGVNRPLTFLCYFCNLLIFFVFFFFVLFLFRLFRSHSLPCAVQSVPRSQLRQTLRHLRLRRLRGLFQTFDTKSAPVRLQVAEAGTVRGGQDAPEPVSGLSSAQVLRGGHEQGRGTT